MIARLTRDDLIRFHQSWIRPDNATIYAVGDLPLAELVPLLEARFGNWTPPAAPKGTKNFAATPPAPRPRIVLVNRPQSPQSLILAGAVLPVRGTDDVLTLNAANEVLGGNFLSRINMDLRETKGWSYGSRSNIGMREQLVPYLINAPVQADKTGPAIRALMDQVSGFVGPKGVTDVELTRVINGNTRQLAGQFETSQAVLERAPLERALQASRQLLGGDRRPLSRNDDQHDRPGRAQGDRSQEDRLGRGRRRRQGAPAAHRPRPADRGSAAEVDRRPGGGRGPGERRGPLSISPPGIPPCAGTTVSDDPGHMPHLAARAAASPLP